MSQSPSHLALIRTLWVFGVRTGLGRVSIPFASGHSFEHVLEMTVASEDIVVSIPFASGHSFELHECCLAFASTKLRLNPLRIGALIRTEVADAKPRLVVVLVSQSPSHRGTHSN